jgi:ABC-2 type transport system permease protein
MVAVVVRMKLAALRHTPGAFWGWRTVLVSAAALGTLALGLDVAADPGRTFGLLALAFAGWTLGRVLAPIQTGGGGDETLLPEHFALLPIPPRRLATVLFAAAFVGAVPLVSLAAFAVLLLVAVQLGIAPALVAIPAMALQLGFVVLLSRVAVGATSAAMTSRLGMEFVALQFSS